MPESLALLKAHPFTAGLSSKHLHELVDCARSQHLEPNGYLWRQGDVANLFYMIRTGQVAIEIAIPHHGSIPIEVIGAGEVVGWSWMVAPYRWQFDARALTPVEAIVLDGLRLRRKCEDDPTLDYQLLKRLAPVIGERLQATRLRLVESQGQTNRKAGLSGRSP